MRELIEEYGFTLISLIVVSVMLLGLMLGIILPQMGNHFSVMVPQDTPENAWNMTPYQATIARPRPTISADTISIPAGTTLNFDNCVADGTIRAINASGADISRNVVVKPADALTRSFFNAELNTFGGPLLVPGEYIFIVSVIDNTGIEYFGQKTQQYLNVIVNQ